MIALPYRLVCNRDASLHTLLGASINSAMRPVVQFTSPVFPEETTLYRVVQENLETFLAQVEAEGAASLPQFVKDEFDAFLECGILAHGFLRLRGLYAFATARATS
jgi:F420-dependent methylenetetrahydromethanopterin dehydrogenase